MKVMFEAPWRNLDDGWSISTRAYARAMAMVGIDVKLLSWFVNEQPLSNEVLAEIPPGMREIPPNWDWDAHVFSCAFGGPENHRQARTFELFRTMNRPPRLFYTMFERRGVQAELVEELNRLEGTWVPCSANQRALEAAGCTKSTWVPYPYFDDDPLLNTPTRLRRPRRFLWIGRWEPRKAPHNLIRAFFEAFKPGEAELTIKIGPTPWIHSSYLGPHDTVTTNLSARWSRSEAESAIHFVEGHLTAAEMRRLYAEADVYVSASRGEGIDLPAFAGRLAGCRVVTTDSGGPRDFLGEYDILVPATGTREAPEYAHLWGEGQGFADYELDDLVTAMQRAASESVIRTPLPTAHRAENVGRALGTWIESCKNR